MSDVIRMIVMFLQDFIQNIRQQHSSAIHLTNTNNSTANPSQSVENPPTKIDTDSASTTLTHLM